MISSNLVGFIDRSLIQPFETVHKQKGVTYSKVGFRIYGSVFPLVIPDSVLGDLEGKCRVRAAYFSEKKGSHTYSYLRGISIEKITEEDDAASGIEGGVPCCGDIRVRGTVRVKNPMRTTANGREVIVFYVVMYHDSPKPTIVPCVAKGGKAVECSALKEGDTVELDGTVKFNDYRQADGSPNLTCSLELLVKSIIVHIPKNGQGSPRALASLKAQLLPPTPTE